ncbi:thiolase-like protein [Usnea florida]
MHFVIKKVEERHCRKPDSDPTPCKRWGQCSVPKERFNIDGYLYPEGDRVGAMIATGGYFVNEDVRQFENIVFGINKVEATHMDPEQRKSLEVVYECFESSGTSLEDVAVSDVGVSVGNLTISPCLSVPDVVPNTTFTSFALETAFSSTIVCLHNAVVALQGGECVKALCTERPSTTLRDSDPILAVVRGTAIQSNGKRPGTTQPSILGQEEAIRQDTTYVECHGTRTGVGDPKEVEARTNFSPRDRSTPLLLRTKTKISHSDATTEISAVIKAGLALERKKNPATIGVKKPNPKHRELPGLYVNSFSYGGANAHAIFDSVENILPGHT